MHYSIWNNNYLKVFLPTIAKLGGKLLENYYSKYIHATDIDRGMLTIREWNHIVSIPSMTLHTDYLTYFFRNDPNARVLRIFLRCICCVLAASIDSTSTATISLASARDQQQQQHQHLNNAQSIPLVVGRTRVVAAFYFDKYGMRMRAIYHICVWSAFRTRSRRGFALGIIA